MINKRQYNILSFYLTRTLFLGGGFTLLIKLGMNDLLISAILGMLFGYFILFMFFKKGSISKFMSSIIAISTLIMGTLSNTVLTSNYLLQSTPTLLIVIIFFSTLLYASTKEFKVIGRVVEIFMFVSFIEITLSLFSLFGLVNVERILPLFTNDTMNIIKGIIVFAGASVLPNLLLINYKEKLEFRDIQWGYIIGSLLMILVLFFVVTIYGSQFASNARFPEFLILKKIDIMGYLTNLENVLATEWIFNVLVTSWLCAKVLRDNMNSKLFYILILGLILGSEFILNRNYINILYVKQYFYYIAFGILVISLIIKKRKN
jgi:hypothetical protein